MLFGFVRIAAINRQWTGMRYEEIKLFKRYVVYIICTVRGDPDKYLKFENSLHNNLQLTLEKVNMEWDLVFLDINVNVSSKSKITCHWYQKPTDTGAILKFWQLCSGSALKKCVSREVSQGFYCNISLVGLRSGS